MRKISYSLVIVLAIGVFLLGSVTHAKAETLEFKNFTQVTKQEVVPIPNVEGHFLGVAVREGVMVFGNGEWAWVKVPSVWDMINRAGTFDQYATITFPDGSTITTHTKGTQGSIPAGTASAKWTGEIIGGTGRFQGIKGTVTASAKMLPLEKGELGSKAISEGTLVYTLPGK